MLDQNGTPIDPLWAAEFCGFFLADGSIEIGRFTRGGKLYYRPRARILQRADSADFLYGIADVLGGHVHNHGRHMMVSAGNGKTYESHPVLAWLVQSTDGVQRVIDILKTSRLNHKKVQSALIVERYLQLRPKKGQYWRGVNKEAVEGLISELVQSRLFEC